MPIADKSHLSRPARARDEGWAPDPVSRFGSVLVEKWHNEGIGSSAAWAESIQARFRHSDAGSCARAIAYAALGLPREPMDLAGHFIARQGTIIHEELQRALEERYGDTALIEAETVVSAGPDMGGHEDAHVVSGPPDWRTSIEAKTVDGFKYKQAVGERYAAKGPSYSHVIQAALNAKSRNADELVILYLARGAISKGAAKGRKISEVGRVVAEWTMTREQYEPIADKEIERVQAILALLDEGTLPKRRIPDPELPERHIITNPTRGEWVEVDDSGKVVDTGDTWHCVYCPYQGICQGTPAERCSTDVLEGRE